jgi:drug/metabolite transporter (DMT)-like permease
VDLPLAPRRSADLLLICVTAIWGATFLLVQNSLSEISPLAFLACRFSLAAAVLFLLNRNTFRRAAILPGIVTGVFLFAGYAFQTIGLQSTTASKSAFLTSLSVPMVPFAAALVYRKAPSRREILGLVFASLGMILLTIPNQLNQISRGDVFSFFCAVSFAAQVVAVSHYAGRGNFGTFVTMQMITVTALSLATCRWAEPFFFRPTRAAYFAIAITGLLATALAFSIQAWAQQFTTVNRAAVIYALEPVFAWLTSFAILGEILSVRASIGAVLILFGILIVELKRSASQQHQIG